MSKMPTETRLMLIHGNTHIPLETVAKWHAEKQVHKACRGR